MEGLGVCARSDALLGRFRRMSINVDSHEVALTKMFTGTKRYPSPR